MDKSTLYLRLMARTDLLPVATAFVEKASGAFGLGKEESLRLTLATEEIFMYLSTRLCPGAPLGLEVFNGIYYIRVDFKFYVAETGIAGLNVAPVATAEEKQDLTDMGLIIATRFVDRLNITRSKHGELDLAITKEKAYPEGVRTEAVRPRSVEKLTIEEPDTEVLKVFSAMAEQYPVNGYRPAFFRYPGKVVDMVFSGEYRALVAVNERKEVCGGIIFNHLNDKIVEFYGPFVFSTEGKEKTGAALLEQCMGRLARTKAIGLMTYSGLPEWLRANFESPGYITFYRKDNTVIRQPVFYRLLHEDPGGLVWTHPDILQYLRNEYERLVLARDIRVVSDLGESRADLTIFSVELVMGKSVAVIRPLLLGADMEGILRSHMLALRNENIANIFVEIDLGISWQAQLMGAIESQGFTPQIVLPFAGQSDLLRFQLTSFPAP